MVILVCVIAPVKGSAQIENIPVGKEVNVDRIYVGLLKYTTLSERETQNYRYAFLQLGARVSYWLIPKKLKIRSFGAMLVKERTDAHFLKSYEAIFNPAESIRISGGIMATPTTILRPNPTTWQSQVETNAESKIIGGRPGLKIRYAIDDDLRLFYGIYSHDKKTVHHFKIAYKNFTISHYIEDKQLFAAVRWDHEDFEIVANWFKNEIAVSSIISISSYWKCYLDMEIDRSTDTLTFGEWGIRRVFSDDTLINGFFSLSYNYQVKSFQGGLFIHI